MIDTALMSTTAFSASCPECPLSNVSCSEADWAQSPKPGQHDKALVLRFSEEAEDCLNGKVWARGECLVRGKRDDVVRTPSPFRLYFLSSHPTF